METEESTNETKGATDLFKRFAEKTSRREQIAHAVLVLLSKFENLTIEEAREALQTADNAIGLIPFSWNPEATIQSSRLFHLI